MPAVSPQSLRAMNPASLRASIRDRYAQVAEQPSGQFPYPTGAASARILGYRSAWLERIPIGVIEHFVGVGNPFDLGVPLPGERVLDLGCGAGFDTLVAAQCVGPGGRIVGIDFSPEMLAVAADGLHQVGCRNVTLVEATLERLPLPDAWADRVLSNGVLNLTPCKASAFAEIARVLRPGGHFQAADLMLVRGLPHDLCHDSFAWSS